MLFLLGCKKNEINLVNLKDKSYSSPSFVENQNNIYDSIGILHNLCLDYLTTLEGFDTIDLGMNIKNFYDSYYNKDIDYHLDGNIIDSLASLSWYYSSSSNFDGLINLLIEQY
ncbi:hypothetical protein, partial [Thermaurantimonas aggregans]